MVMVVCVRHSEYHFKLLRNQFSCMRKLIYWLPVQIEILYYPALIQHHVIRNTSKYRILLKTVG